MAIQTFIPPPQTYNSPPRSVVDITRELADRLRFESPEMRADVFAALTENYCRECGSDDPGCQCWNDE